jgi:hypothetical protein
VKVHAIRRGDAHARGNDPQTRTRFSISVEVTCFREANEAFSTELAPVRPTLGKRQTAHLILDQVEIKSQGRWRTPTLDMRYESVTVQC